jgi:hypothetical protein
MVKLLAIAKRGRIPCLSLGKERLCLQSLQHMIYGPLFETCGLEITELLETEWLETEPQCFEVECFARFEVECFARFEVECFARFEVQCFARFEVECFARFEVECFALFEVECFERFEVECIESFEVEFFDPVNRELLGSVCFESESFEREGFEISCVFGDNSALCKIRLALSFPGIVNL